MLERRIADEDDLAKFHATETYKDLTKFIEDLNLACIDSPIGYSSPSTEIQTIKKVLDQIESSLPQFPCAPTKSRFGKPEFRDFCNFLVTELPAMLSELTNEPEVSEYLSNSFGNSLRIDYGSGHELNFICFLLCLVKLKKLQKSDYKNLALGVFDTYLKLMHEVQTQFYLEPAGSHGVWGLDDYHFLPFMFGSAQIINDKYVRPMSIHDFDIVDMYKDKNYYFRQIFQIDSVKTSSLRWHSPMLDDISGVKTWKKVNEGMIKMYKAEVLGKLPVIQHFLFGNILKPDPMMTKKIGEEVHVQCWADCCGIRVPSAIAAKQQGRTEAGQTRTRTGNGTGHVLKKLDSIPVD